jgi:hypothetical protein
MPVFQIRVGRVVREDTILQVEAASEEVAKSEAKLLATSVPPEKWDCYDCEYWTD